MNSDLFDYKKAAEIVDAHSEKQHFIGGNGEDLIDLAEKRLRVSFPLSYKEFLGDFGGGSFGSSEIYGVIHDNFEESGVPDMVWRTQIERKNGLPCDLIVICDEGDGWIDCIRCSGETRGEVVGYYTPAPAEIQEYEVLYSGFGNFFLDAVKSQISD